MTEPKKVSDAVFITCGNCGKKLNPTDSIVDHMSLEHPKEWKEFLRNG